MGPYYTSSEDFRLHFSDCYIFELQLVLYHPSKPTVTMSPKDLSVQSFVDPFDSIQTTNYLPRSMIPWPKWWVSPTTMGFPNKNDHFGVFWGYHHSDMPSIVLILHIRNPIFRACLSAATTLAEALAKPPKLWALGIGAVHGGFGWICQLIFMYLNKHLIKYDYSMWNNNHNNATCIYIYIVSSRISAS